MFYLCIRIDQLFCCRIQRRINTGSATGADLSDSTGNFRLIACRLHRHYPVIGIIKCQHTYLIGRFQTFHTLHGCLFCQIQAGCSITAIGRYLHTAGMVNYHSNCHRRNFPFSFQEHINRKYSLQWRILISSHGKTVITAGTDQSSGIISDITFQNIHESVTQIHGIYIHHYHCLVLDQL